MKKRKQYKKPKKVKCKECGKLISPYILSQHIKKEHNLKEYIKKYGEFRKSEISEKLKTRKIKKVVCKICGKKYSIVGLSNHLLDTHNISTAQYIKKYGEFRPKYLDYISRAKKNKIKCQICNEVFGSERLLTYHIKNKHNMNKRDYIIQYIFNGKIPKCKCGCNLPVKILNQYPYYRTYIQGHNSIGSNNPNFNVIPNNKTLNKMRISAINRIGKTNKASTKPELQFKRILDNLEIEYISQYPTKYGVIDFYLPIQDMYIEIDGIYWHPLIKENLNFQLISEAISEHRKLKIGNKLFRLRSDKLINIKSIEDIKKYSDFPKLDLTFKQKIINKEYFKNYINKKGKNRLQKYIPLLLKFIREFQPKFPTISTKENLSQVIKTIQNYDLSKILINSHNNDIIFRNNCSNIGVSYLKSHHKSYWKSSYKNSISPVNAWKDNKIMKEIIKYRIGINNSNEIFDFSLHQMIRGMSARRITISFFKPLVAAAIYKYFLKNAKNPTVIDPCAGFGGRMVGFKAIYPNGKYIGIEPNIETYNELVKLSENFTNVKLYNCKLEDYKGSKECDLTFTSIPYFDLETYSNPTKYQNIKHWKNTFITSLKTYNNLIINLSDNLEYLFKNYNNKKYYLQNNTSHFNTSNNQKLELILKIN